MSPKMPPIRLEMATSTVPTALPPEPLGAFCTASSRVTLCTISLWLTRNVCSRLNSAGILFHNDAPCATSGGMTSRPRNTTAATITA